MRNNFSEFPKVHLGFFPTPFHKLDRLSSVLGREIYIKRDDLTGMSSFGGNKIRKLEFLLGEAVSLGCDTVITIGATQSNHVMETATACRRCGLSPVLYIITEPGHDTEQLSANLLLNQILGAELKFIPHETGTLDDAFKEAALQAEEYGRFLDKNGHKCYVIYGGGASPLGSVAYAEAFVELEDQCRDAGFVADYVFHSTGTGGTLAGLLAGKAMTQSNTEIIAFAAGAKQPDYTAQVADLTNATLRLLGEEFSYAAKDIFVDCEHYGQGYEIPDARASDTIRFLARTEGLFIDPVYTGKAFLGMLDYIEKHNPPADKKIVFLHTGGNTAIFAGKEISGLV